MSLAAGARLGPYEIVSQIGAGGMGEVYRAHDTRLDRPVAIKVLALDISTSPEARQRFEREARTVSRLSHPNICQLHDVGTEDGAPFLVMELVDGETLAARLSKGPLPLETTIRYGMHIAEALEVAHRAGVVHRDLKPANVMLPKSGLKLLDFGLAKDAPAAQATVTAHPITAPGVAAGTVQYMAPEVLEGHQADHRSDIYALGAVLYEMASGKRAFAGATETLMPPTLDRIVRGCLAADPDDRWQSAHDVRLQLASVGGVGDPASAVGAPQRTKLASAWMGWAVAVLAAGVAVASLVRSRGPAESSGVPAIRFSVPPPRGGAFYDNLENAPIAVAPDGSHLAFLATDAERALRIWVRPMTAVDAQPICRHRRGGRTHLVGR